MILSNIGENLTLLNKDSNGHSVPATVPGKSHTSMTIADLFEFRGLG